MTTLRKALIFFLLSALFAAKLGTSYGHSLLQRSSSRSEFDCTLTSEQLQPHSGGEGRWLVTNSTLQDLEGDIQTLVDCTEEGDMLLFDVEAPVQPSRRITIRWNLTLSTFVEDPRLQDGTFPEARKKVTFQCPRQDEGVFFVKGNEILFANFAFQSCSLKNKNEDARRGIITIASCTAKQNWGTVRLHHVDFEENVLRRSAALFVRKPSCSSIQILHLRFQYNFCAGVCAAHLPSWNEIQNIRLTKNRFFEDDSSDHVLIGLESGSNTIINGLSASANDGIAVRVWRSDFRIYNSHVFQNSGEQGLDGCYHTGGLSVQHSSGEILNSRFERNTGYVGSSLSVENSRIVIRRTTVIGCTSTSRGGGISIGRSSKVRILDSVIVNNSAGSEGGGIYCYGANHLKIKNTIFETNSAETGGGLFIEEGSLEMSDNTFRSNSASGSGGGVFALKGPIVVQDSIFISCSVDELGGGLYIQRSLYSLTNLTLIRNEADTGGGLLIQKSSGSFSNSQLQRNSARSHGGGLELVRSNETVVQKCSFDRNTADLGGALVSYNSITEVLESSFESNEASSDGGAIDIEGSGGMTLEGCSFTSNSAGRSGGAISVWKTLVSGANLRFQNDRASQFGGAVSMQRRASAAFSHSKFFNEYSGHRGGAVSATQSEITLRNITIEFCVSKTGGGVYFKSSLASINETSVTSCEASKSGGGIRMIESNVTSRGLDVLLNTAIGTPRQRSAGGGIAVENSSNLSLRNGTLKRNKAQYGAGIYGISESDIFMHDGYLLDNIAVDGGGAAYVHGSVLTLLNVSCRRNSALNGGSLYAYNSSLTLNDSRLINSSSTATGGSVLAQGGSTIVMERTMILSGNAANGGGIMLTGSHFLAKRVQFRNCSATFHGGGVKLTASSSFLCTNCSFESNSAFQEGGALRLESAEPQTLAFQLENTVFRDNDANFGGAIHFQTGDDSVNLSDANSANCTFLALAGCVFENNSAFSVGGAILANNPNAIRISCDPANRTNPFAYYTREEVAALREFSSLDKVCDTWKANNASIYGSAIGSYARQVAASILTESDRTMEVVGNRYVLRNHSSGYPLPMISLKAIDEFSQGPALIQANRVIEGVAMAGNGLFDGNVDVRIVNGQGNFSGVTAFKEPGMYAIHISFSGRGISTLTIDTEIRECLIGEARTGNGTMCEPCGDTTYNFDPLKFEECISCPEDANCDSIAIRPKKGFWHQTPCSNHVQHCVLERACDEEDRDTRLLELESNLKDCDFNDEFVIDYSEALCREGYMGPLCGSCKPSHGKTRSFRCEECYGRFVSVCLVLVTALVLLVLAAFTIKGALPARQRSASRDQSRSGASSSLSINIQMVEMRCTGRVPPEVIHPHLRRQENGTNTTSVQQQDQSNADLAKWKSSEIFKITINYLQGIAIAITVNVAWTGALITLFDTAEFIGGMTAEAANHSADCLVSANSSTPRSAVTTIVNLLTPVIVASVFAVLWTIAKIRNKQSYSYLVKRCILSAMVVSYLSYTAITKTAVNIFYCVKVYDSDDFDDDSTTKYWAVDTALVCFDGSHSMLSFVFGLPVLLLFSVGFPCLVTCVLVMKRRQKDIQSPWLYETAGFLYRPYDEKFIFWESVVLLRKAAFAIIVIFAYPLGGNLQGILAVCVLMIALYLHLHCRPYRSEFDMLNRLEGLSLLVSSLTFVSGLFLNDDRTSSEARATITALVVFANILLFFYLFVRFFVASAAYLRIVLDNEGVAYDQSASAFHIVKTYLKHKLDLHLGAALRRVTAFLSKHDEEPDTNAVEIEVASGQ